MKRQKIILKYLYENNCKTQFCDIKNILVKWTPSEVVNTLSTLRQTGKIKISDDSNFNGLGHKQLGILQTLDRTIIKVVLLDEGEKYYKDNYVKTWKEKYWLPILIITNLMAYIGGIFSPIFTDLARAAIQEKKTDCQTKDTTNLNYQNTAQPHTGNHLQR